MHRSHAHTHTDMQASRHTSKQAGKVAKTFRLCSDAAKVKTSFKKIKVGHKRERAGEDRQAGEVKKKRVQREER